MSGKCMKCEKALTYVNLEPMKAHHASTQYLGVAYKCPHCQTIISFQMDPIAIKTDTVKAIKGY